MAETKTVIAVLWEWKEGTPHAGARFWGCHGTTSDGRIKDWPRVGLRALGAAKVTIVEGDGLDLLRLASATDAEKAREDAR